MDLIVGATGQLGGLVAKRLLGAGEEVRALVRESSEHEELKSAGAELVFGDLKRPETLKSACRGMRRIVATATAAARGGDDTVERVDREGYQALIATAEEEGIERFVFVSAQGFRPDSPVALARAKAATEEQLRASSLDHTILHPVLFMEGWIGWVIGGQLEQGPKVQVIGSAGRRYSFVSIQNVADLAIAAREHPGASRATIPLSAGAHSFGEIMEWIREETGQMIAVEEVEPGTPIPGLPAIVLELWSWAAQGGMGALETPEVAERYGLNLIPPRAWVAGAFGGG